MALLSRPRPLRFFHRGEDGTHRDVRGAKARGFPGHGGKNSCGDRRYARYVLLQHSNAWTDRKRTVNARNAQPGRLRTWRLHHVFDRPVRLETFMEHFRHETDSINIDRYRCTNIPPCALELYNGNIQHQVQFHNLFQSNSSVLQNCASLFSVHRKHQVTDRVFQR